MYFSAIRDMSFIANAWCGLLGCVKKEITFEIKIDTQQPPVLHSLRCGKGSQHLTPDSGAGQTGGIT